MAAPNTPPAGWSGPYAHTGGLDSPESRCARQAEQEMTLSRPVPKRAKGHSPQIELKGEEQNPAGAPAGTGGGYQAGRYLPLQLLRCVTSTTWPIAFIDSGRATNRRLTS